MTTAKPETKIFGMRLGVDPKFLVIGLFVIVAVIAFLHLRGGSDETTTANVPVAAAPAAAPSTTRPVRRRLRSSQVALDRGTLRLRPVDASRGDIDPTLRLDMLIRLQNSPEATSTRSLFEVGEAMPTNQQIAKVNQTVIPRPLPAQAAANPGPTQPVTPTINVPLKFYGFVKTAHRADTGKGLFLNGDNIIVARPGDVVESHYKIVSLTPQQATVEDTNMHQQQTLNVIPEAAVNTSAGASAFGGPPPQGFQPQPTESMDQP